MNSENVSSTFCDLMGQSAFKTLSTDMKKQYFIEKYQYIFGKKFRQDVYIPNKMEYHTGEIFYAEYVIKQDSDGDDYYDYSFTQFKSKKLHQKFIDGSDLAWCARYEILQKKYNALFYSLLRKKRQEHKWAMKQKYGW